MMNDSSNGFRVNVKRGRLTPPPVLCSKHAAEPETKEFKRVRGLVDDAVEYLGRVKRNLHEAEKLIGTETVLQDRLSELEEQVISVLDATSDIVDSLYYK